MRETRTFLICPKCKRPTSLDYVRTDRDSAHYVCSACDWSGREIDADERSYHTEVGTTTKIAWNVIDEIVYDFYGHETQFGIPYFGLVTNGVWGNDSSHQFNVEPDVGAWAKKDAEKFRRDGKPRGLCNADVMNILCEDGWLAPGKYLVEVCW